MADTRKKNVTWTIATNPNGTTPHGDAVLAVQMDIRDELQRLNRIFECGNLMRMPHDIERMRKAIDRLNRRAAKMTKLR